MTKEEYQDYAKKQEDWSPGWDAIDDCFQKVYPDQKPGHYATDMIKRAILGGDQFLDGYSIYQSGKGYKHLVTFGMSELYANADAFGEEYSKWGYEMTIKLPVDSNEDCLWAIDMLSNLARYTFTQKKYFEPHQYISGGGNPIKIGSDSKITALLVVADTEINGVDTLHGRLDFMQLVGIVQAELEAIIENPAQTKVLVERMKKDNPDLITDLERTKSYL